MTSLPENFGSQRFVLLVCLFTGAIVHSNQMHQMVRGAALEPENAAAAYPVTSPPLPSGSAMSHGRIRGREQMLAVDD